jgi:hypothetical protein
MSCRRVCRNLGIFSHTVPVDFVLQQKLGYMSQQLKELNGKIKLAKTTPVESEEQVTIDGKYL